MYSNIRILLRDYINIPNAKKPLSIAVFGRPGSGKSFCVKEIAQNVAPEKIKPLKYNLSQFGTAEISSLNRFFHEIEDYVAAGKVPITFFDEFDSLNLDWIKFFLAPMKDGVYSEKGILHPLGKCVFVFAGGTSYSLADFVEKSGDDAATKKEPDFLSRLKGYIDIPNIDLSKELNFSVRMLVAIRHAIMLPGALKKAGKDGVHLSNPVISALLNVREYKHGARSMQAIIGMSQKPTRSILEISDLPHQQQLSLHVDLNDFITCSERGLLQYEVKGQLARALAWNTNEQIWGDLKRDSQEDYYKKAADLLDYVTDELDLRVGLCGDTRKVPSHKDDPEITIIIPSELGPSNWCELAKKAIRLNEETDPDIDLLKKTIDCRKFISSFQSCQNP